MSTDFRSIARKALAVAKVELASADNERLRHAALQLRMAMEALTYERAHAYEKMLPPHTYASWQPRKLLLALLEIDPTADKGSTLFMGLEETAGVEAKDFSHIGTEYTLDFATIKKHYDALGSFLHLPTLRQINAGKVTNNVSCRRHCDEAAITIERALSSSMYNMVFGKTIDFSCDRCKAKIERVIPIRANFKYETTCECGAPYIISDERNDSIGYAALYQKIDCTRNECDGKVFVWKDQLVPGTVLSCETCGSKHSVVLRVVGDK